MPVSQPSFQSPTLYSRPHQPPERWFSIANPTHGFAVAHGSSLSSSARAVVLSYKDATVPVPDPGDFQPFTQTRLPATPALTLAGGFAFYERLSLHAGTNSVTVQLRPCCPGKRPQLIPSCLGAGRSSAGLPRPQQVTLRELCMIRGSTL